MLSIFLFTDILIAFLIDLIAGDPYWLPHPVRFIGGLIHRMEGLLRPLTRKGRGEELARNERIAGAFLMISVVAITFLAVFLLLRLSATVHPVVFHVVNIYFLYTSLATRCLAHEAKKVYRVLRTEDLVKARQQLSMLVGRETEQLNTQEVAKAVIETTAENTVDGIVSPLLYAVAGSFFGLGAPLAYAFKAISTLDSMVGYMNEKYIHFGRVSAKTDDAANYIPARLSGLIIPVGAWLCGLKAGKSLFIMKRDRHNHKSPNCAYPEAAFAGALGIQLGGTHIYFGRPVIKPTIGDPEREVKAEDILKAIRLMVITSILTLIFAVGPIVAFAIFRG